MTRYPTCAHAVLAAAAYRWDDVARLHFGSSTLWHLAYRPGGEVAAKAITMMVRLLEIFE